jgi:hypothetical protein
MAALALALAPAFIDIFGVLLRVRCLCFDIIIL